MTTWANAQAYRDTLATQAPQVGRVWFQGKLYEVQRGFVNATAAGNTQMVAAPGAGKRVVVLWMLVTNKDTAVRNYKIQSGTTDVTATHQVAVSGGGANWWHQGVVAICNENQACNFNMDNIGNIGVDFEYIIADI